MIDPVLEKQIAAIDDLNRIWNDFVKRLDMARKGANEDKEFVQARETIAKRYGALMGELEISVSKGDELLSLLSRFCDCGEVSAVSDFQWSRVMEDRGRIGGEILRLAGSLNERKKSIALVSRSGLIMRRVLLSPPLKLLYLIAGVMIIFLVLQVLLL